MVDTVAVDTVVVDTVVVDTNTGADTGAAILAIAETFTNETDDVEVDDPLQNASLIQTESYTSASASPHHHPQTRKIQTSRARRPWKKLNGTHEHNRPLQVKYSLQHQATRKRTRTKCFAPNPTTLLNSSSHLKRDHKHKASQ